jgi:decaprenylphospho-beta-D-ribofuranose 2-oxidase
MILSGWGNYPAIDCRTRSLRNNDDFSKIFAKADSLIARGNGRAYGDAALNPNITLLMRDCDRFLLFDKSAGLVECEAGLLLSDLLALVVPHGWFPPVVPGTKFVTIGGMIAADVHGKNHHRDGSFGRYVESLRLALADGTIINCSHSENSEIFSATVGGMGLTGVILSAEIRLRPISSDLIKETVVRVPSLDALLQMFEEHRTATYSVAWVDCLARGSHSGRAILMLGEHADSSGPQGRRMQAGPRSKLSVPFDLPLSLLNTWCIKIFNEFYYRLQRSRQRLAHYDGYFFPLDKVQNWNRIYGRQGFVQYQCVIGGSDAKAGLHRIVKLVHEIGQGSFLAVLKQLGPGNRFLSFPMEGYTITLDFPVRSKIFKDLEKLDAIVAEHRGRIYLAKDARAPRELIEKGYPEIDAFRELRRNIDPHRKIRSVLSERLSL